METATTVELTVKENFPKLDKCCFFVSLRLGINIWLGVEATIWLFLFVISLYFEAIWIDEVELTEFIHETDDWYFILIFGDRFYYLDQRMRTYIILINFLLMMSFITYLAFCIVLVYGVNLVKTNFFIPYLVFDAIFMFLACIGCIVSFFTANTHLFRISFIFLVVKVYVELCVVSLFREYRLRPKELSSSKSSSTSGEGNEGDETTAV